MEAATSGGDRAKVGECPLMSYSRPSRRVRTRRGLIAITVLTACVIAAPLYAIDAGAAPTSVHGSVNESNTCTNVLTPELQPPGNISLSSQLATNASPEPHNTSPITLSTTTFAVVYPSLFGGFIADGTMIPVSGSLVVGGSNTTEATHTYSLTTSMTFQTGHALIATFTLPATTWHPVLGNVASVFTKQSFSTALSLDLTGIGTVVATFTCLTPASPALVTLHGTPNTTTTKATTTTQPTTTTTAPKPTLATCTGTRGTIDSVPTTNGAEGEGLLYTKKSRQQFKLSASGQGCTGTFVSGARTRMVVTTKTLVNCQTLPTATLGGSGTFTWTAPPGVGASNFSVHWYWSSKTSIHFSGSVSTGGSAAHMFRGKHVSGNLTTLQSLAAVASGGSCSATQPLRHFDITKIIYRIT
jgi:hypothetical protein